jgi:23S rRNA G2069 N7-methylase RlmK/C1962 C5-methylase RlmI
VAVEITLFYCSGEGDNLSGLIVDVFNDVIVAQSGAFWVESNRHLIEDQLRSHLKLDRCIWQRLESRLSLEGWVSGERPSSAGDNCPLLSAEVLENGIRYKVFPELGQKTGFYCDHRENRALIRSLSKDKDVLDLYTYTGGFSINAALGCAKSVIAVDSSKQALQWAQLNADANGVGQKVEYVCDDVVKRLKVLQSQDRTFDVVVCDPPKLAPSHTNLNAAISKYTQINQLALSLVKPGGILMTCSCSGAMSQEGGHLRSVIQSAANKAGRNVRILSRRSTGPDHPIDINCPESEYLSVYVLYVD